MATPRPTPALGLRQRARMLASHLASWLPSTVRLRLRRFLAIIFHLPEIHAELEGTYKRVIGAAGAAAPRARRTTAKGPRVLMATNIGSYPHGMALDTAVGIALTLRDARVDYMQCDAALPACMAMEINSVDPAVLANGKRPDRCDECTRAGASLISTVGLPRLAMSELVSEADRDAIRRRVGALGAHTLKTITDNGIAIGEHAFAGALRFYARGDLDGEQASDGVLRRYVEGALVTATAVERAIEREHYDVVVAHHGIYVPQGIVGEVCRRRGVRLVTWNPAYRKHCFVFSHGDTYHHTMVSEPTANWESLTWSKELERETLDYLDSRWHGGEDWIWFHTNPQQDAAAIAAETGIDFDRPVITLLSNVIWDAQLHYPSNAFPSMLNWVFETIRYFASRPELQLVIRVHPAEVTGFLPSRQRLVDEIARVFPTVPANVRIVPPESNVSTYALCEHSNAVLIYNTKTGVELTAKGIPTVIAGEAWIRNKGFCHSPTNAVEYFAVLDRLPFAARMTDEERQRALMYAYHIFFRRMIPLPFFVPRARASFALEIDSIDQLGRGRYVGLDVICDGILAGSPFIYPAELIRERPPTTSKIT